MDINNLYINFPGMGLREQTMLQQITATLDETQRAVFLSMYANKRKNPEDVKLYCIAGILVPGLQRFMLGQITWGVLSFVTGGFFLVMTVMDIINYKELALEYNYTMAGETLQVIRRPNTYAI